MDFTLNNTKIKSFLDGNDDFPPTAELIYLHEHPLVKPNFLFELQELIEKVDNRIRSKKIKGYPIEELAKVALVIGTALPDGVTEDNALMILIELRKTYVICNKILAM